MYYDLSYLRIDAKFQILVDDENGDRVWVNDNIIHKNLICVDAMDTIQYLEDHKDDWRSKFFRNPEEILDKRIVILSISPIREDETLMNENIFVTETGHIDPDWRPRISRLEVGNADFDGLYLSYGLYDIYTSRFENIPMDEFMDSIKNYKTYSYQEEFTSRALEILKNKETQKYKWRS